MSNASPMSNKSTSSFETIKASKLAMKRSLKSLLSTSGNNKTLPKVQKSDQVFMSGRGGARRIKKSDTPPVPTNTEILNNLIASSRGDISRHHSIDDSNSDDARTISSGFTSPSGSSFMSKGSKAIVKTIVREVLGGAGNNADLEPEGQFVVPYGRGGAIKPAISCRSSDIELVSTGWSDSSLSIARNSHGLFFFGQGRQPSLHSPDGHSDYLVVGPATGFSNLTNTDPTTKPSMRTAKDSLAQASGMSRTMMTKLTIKVACKEVLGGGGNDSGDWKYLDIFVPCFGRGGEGAKGLRVLDDIFSPRKRRRLNQRGTGASDDDLSSMVFPSISSDASSLHARSITSEGDDWMYENYQQRPPASSYRDFVASDNSSADTLRQRRLYGEHYSTKSRRDHSAHNERQDSTQYEPLHSPELLAFRDRLLEERRQRIQGKKFAPGYKVPNPTFEPSQLSDGLYSRSDTTTIQQGFKASSEASLCLSACDHTLPQQRQDALSFTSETLAAHALALALALVEARTQLFQASQVDLTADIVEPDYAHIAREQAELRREREILSHNVAALRDEIERREKTMEGLNWLVANMPEYQGRDVSVSGDTEDDLDDDLLELLEEAEAELAAGESRRISELQPAIAESTLELPWDR
ncbi:hypothetical protein FRB94_012584 [Tulasnella sp. JGI-2019a]|nr:hypothetical protein FRB93_001453 [Tulasnella sp. JGI-2019a]KAG9009060.1 hypothetical protein FRB94_012584 [Tulasnella sp. JGI-2019a]